MLNKYNVEFYKQFNLADLDEIRNSKPKPSLNRPSGEHMQKYMKDRVEKLRELYDKHEPEIIRIRVTTAEHDKRHHTFEEQYVGEVISPFDLPDFDEQMPKIEDYIVE